MEIAIAVILVWLWASVAVLCSCMLSSQISRMEEAQREHEHMSYFGAVHELHERCSKCNATGCEIHADGSCTKVRTKTSWR